MKFKNMKKYFYGNIMLFLLFVSLIALPNCACAETLKADTNPAVIATLKTNYDEINKIEEDQELQASLEKWNIIARKYTLGPNDIISINISNAPQYSLENARVQPDGYINIGLIGEINVSGMTVKELTDLLTEKYKKYIKNPQITVNIINTKPFLVYITGAVNNPGSYELNTNANNIQYFNSEKPESSIERKTPMLTNILMAAGGIQHDADIENIQITNVIEGTKFSVNLLELIEKGNVTQDVYLTAGDTVYIPRLASAFSLKEETYKKYASATFSPRYIPVRIQGYVNRPGIVKLDPADSLSLNSAIASAGGYLSDSAYPPSKVFLSRVDSNGNLVTKTINPRKHDITLMPNDIVYVPEKIRSSIGKSFDYMSRVFTPFSIFTQSYNQAEIMFGTSDLIYRP
ncbi:MAG TPA: polysaccharide biosynthesis/export family protein [Candidatus Gastranaerophilales bacterium]|nr:polysaccharide biosynthesis/export family protein [Candidatus Gastranaerophilales bacterium]